MKSAILAAAALLPACLATLTDTTPYDDKIGVCEPDFEPGEVVPPCIAATLIETFCTPNGTDPSDYLAHAQCMCDGSFFEDWNGCQDCLYIHGLRTFRESEYYWSIKSVASEKLCTGTPTLNFQAIFKSVHDASIVPKVTEGPTTLRDQYPSNSAVSVYFTAHSTQGPGKISVEASPEGEWTAVEPTMTEIVLDSSTKVVIVKPEITEAVSSITPSLDSTVPRLSSPSMKEEPQPHRTSPCTMDGSASGNCKTDPTHQPESRAGRNLAEGLAVVMAAVLIAAL